MGWAEKGEERKQKGVTGQPCEYTQKQTSSMSGSSLQLPEVRYSALSFLNDESKHAPVLRSDSRMCQFLAVQSHCFVGAPATQQGIWIDVVLFYRSGILYLRMKKILVLKMLLLYIYTPLCIHIYVYICTFFQPTARQFSLGILGQSWCFQDYFKGMLMLSCATEWRSCLVNRVWQRKRQE